MDVECEQVGIASRPWGRASVNAVLGEASRGDSLLCRLWVWQALPASKGMAEVSAGRRWCPRAGLAPILGGRLSDIVCTAISPLRMPLMCSVAFSTLPFAASARFRTLFRIFAHGCRSPGASEQPLDFLGSCISAGRRLAFLAHASQSSEEGDAEELVPDA